MAYTVDYQAILDRVNRSVKACKCGSVAKVHMLHNTNLTEAYLVVCKNGHRGRMLAPHTEIVTGGKLVSQYVDAIISLVWEWNNPSPTAKEYMEHYA